VFYIDSFGYSCPNSANYQLNPGKAMDSPVFWFSLSKILSSFLTNLRNVGLKNISQIEHSRHRSLVNCFVNILGGLIAYCHQPKKPAIASDHNLLLPA